MSFEESFAPHNSLAAPLTPAKPAVGLIGEIMHDLEAPYPELPELPELQFVEDTSHKSQHSSEAEERESISPGSKEHSRRTAKPPTLMLSVTWSKLTSTAA